jgi:hypothetical protein
MENLTDIALSCIPKTRYINEIEFWDRYERYCKNQGIIAFPAQAKNAIQKLKRSGKITHVKGKGIKKND